MTKRDQQYRDYVAEHAAPRAAHSPAPWHVATLNGGFVISTAPKEDGEWTCVAVVPGCKHTVNHADAALMAAAPDMFNCLSRIVNAPPDSPRLYDEIESAIPALLKAKGLLR